LSGIVIADASPLIGLAKIGQLPLLSLLYEEIWIPPAVHVELKPDAKRPGSEKLKEALEAGWLRVAAVEQFSAEVYGELSQTLDPGESEAIALAEALNARFLLIDERRGRDMAARRGIPIAGIGAVLLAAKRYNHIANITTELNALQKVGYRLSATLVQKLVKLAGE
jgi:predicted nucleic acid-binding protein